MTVVRPGDLVFASLAGRMAADPLRAILSASSVRIVQLEHSPGRRAHRHPRCEEIVYVAEGHGAVWMDGATTPVAAGDVVHVPAGVAHATLPRPGTAMRLVCFFPDPDLSSTTVETDLVVTPDAVPGTDTDLATDPTDPDPTTGGLARDRATGETDPRPATGGTATGGTDPAPATAPTDRKDDQS